MQTPIEQPHVSRNRLEGSLGDTPLDRLLEECHKHQVTGTVRVDAGDQRGEIALRVGFVDAATYGELSDDAAVDAMRELPDGDYELVQRLPDLGGALGDAAQFEGDTDELSLVELMQHCEDNALSCTITIISDFDRGQIQYRAGEIVAVELNGRRDDDKIVDMVRFEDARFRVSAPPLDLGISGWPSLRPEPTAPFKLDQPKREDDATARTPVPPPAVNPIGAFAIGMALAVLLLAVGFAAAVAWSAGAAP